MKNMVVLVDTNVIVDFTVKREPYYSSSAEIIRLCASGRIRGCMAFHSVPNLWYIFRKIPESERRAWLLDICEILEVVGVQHDDVVAAIKKKDFQDLEDCLQDQCARAAGAEYIVTRNVRDFRFSEVKAISPGEFLTYFRTSGL